MIDTDTRAAKDFYREVRTFAERSTNWNTNAVYYETLPDETYDLTLVSQRVYGRRDEYLTIMAAAGLDTVDQPLTQRRLILPSPAYLHYLKRRCNFESMDAFREDYRPTWSAE